MRNSPISMKKPKRDIWLNIAQVSYRALVTGKGYINHTHINIRKTQMF